MPYRITSSTFADRAIHFSSFHSSNIAKFQQQITSGMRFQRPSEDPFLFRQVSSLKSRYAELEADDATIVQSTAVLNASVSQIEELTTLLSKAKTLTQQGIQALGDPEREAIALEVDGLLEQLKSIGLARFNGKYLYGGTRSNTPPFQFSSPEQPGGTLEVNYTGSTLRSRASVSDTIGVDTYYNGREIFGDLSRQPTVLFGNSGAKPGAGTDTLVGRAILQVTHETTTYAGGSGVLPAADSSSGDTIIGAMGAHSLTIVDTAGDGSAGTISLNGYDPVPFTNSDVNLRVEGAHGQVVYVNTTNITPGFNGNVDIESTGSLSVDQGNSKIPIDFSSNQVVVDSNSEKFVTIDSSQIRQTSADRLEFPGTSNAFQVLFELSQDLRNSQGLDSQSLAAALDRRLGELENISRNAFEVLGEQATSLSTLDTLGNRIKDLQLSVEKQINEVQGANLPEAIIQLENSQMMLQYTYSVTAKLSNMGLLEFLR